MTKTASKLFPDADAAPAAVQGTGILPAQVLRELIRSREIVAAEEIAEAQIQPASIDLRLGAVAYRVRASFLPGPTATVRDKIDQLGMHEIALGGGAVLEKGCVYIVPLMEHLALSSRIWGLANPKSSTGRLDIFTRLITDRAAAFERVEAGYSGPLYAEISPRTFSIVVRAGSRLSQLRLRRGTPAAYSDAALRRLHDAEGLVDRDLGRDSIDKGIPLSVDLGADLAHGLIGYRAKTHAGLIDVDKVDHYEPLDYWEPIRARGGEGIVLNPGDFYILASREAVTVPPDHAAEMRAYDTLVGEFRVHYAGFFDPGFGHSDGGGAGSRAVLEVRSHDVPFMLGDGQIVGRLIYERLTGRPDKLYSTRIGSSYQRQGLALAKQFKAYEA